MRAKDAKTIPISDYLSREGVNPVKQRKSGGELWYSSPLRAGDSNPSFTINTEHNIWYDHGLAIGGTIIDLICTLENATVKESLAILDSSGLSPGTPIDLSYFAKLPSFSEKAGLAGKKEKVGESTFEIKSETDIRNPALLQYLDSRCIDHDIAGRYLKEIRFCSRGKIGEFFALGWPNGDGYETRSSIFKGFVGTRKDISRIGLADGKSLSIFEGFFDFLAFLTYYKIKDFQNAAIILNSTSLRKRTLEEIDYYDFSKVYLFLDNDVAGNDCKDFFQLAIEDVEVVDKSNLYAGYKDFNEMTIGNS